LYLTAMTNLTATFGRILPANRCVERSIHDLHRQIKQLVDADVIQCISPNDPVLAEQEAAAAAAPASVRTPRGRGRPPAAAAAPASADHMPAVTLVGRGAAREPRPMLLPTFQPFPVPHMVTLTADQTDEVIASMEAELPTPPPVTPASMSDVMSMYALLMANKPGPSMDASALARQEFDFM
jgi:hypothetical protein